MTRCGLKWGGAGRNAAWMHGGKKIQCAGMHDKRARIE